MPRKNYHPKEIITKLREADILISQGQTVASVIKALGVSDVTYYRCRKDFGGMHKTQLNPLILFKKSAF
jgi:putative transposase